MASVTDLPAFDALLEGTYEVNEHFKTAPLNKILIRLHFMMDTPPLLVDRNSRVAQRDADGGVSISAPIYI
jgi:hypothetical protein